VFNVLDNGVSMPQDKQRLFTSVNIFVIKFGRWIEKKRELLSARIIVAVKMRLYLTTKSLHGTNTRNIFNMFNYII